MKPTGVASWAREVGAVMITEPTDLKKQIGWSGGEKPAAQYLNYIQRNAADWVRYLGYDYLCDDDFCRSPSLAVTQGDTGAWYPEWAADNAIVIASVSTGAMGVARLLQSSTNVAYIDKYVGDVGHRDYLFEGVAMGVSHSSTGSAFMMGIRNVAWFTATGPSGPVNFHWRPTPGASPTGISFAVDFVSASNYRRYEFERIGSTMTVAVDGLRVAVIKDAPSPVNAMVSVEAGASGALPTVVCIFQADRVRFGVRRT